MDYSCFFTTIDSFIHALLLKGFPLLTDVSLFIVLGLFLVWSLAPIIGCLHLVKFLSCLCFSLFCSSTVSFWILDSSSLLPTPQPVSFLVTVHLDLFIYNTPLSFSFPFGIHIFCLSVPFWFWLLHPFSSSSSPLGYFTSSLASFSPQVTSEPSPRVWQLIIPMW